MKRHTFLQATAAAVTAAVTPSLSHGALSDQVVSDQVTKLPSSVREPQYLFVVPRYADEIYQAMGRPRNAKVVNPGSMLAGYQADTILVDDAWDAPFKEGEPPAMAQTRKDWMEMGVECRATPDCNRLTMEFTHQPFDWGSRHGYAYAFTDSGGARRRQGVRMPAQGYRHADMIAAKAKLFNWYLELSA